MSPQAEGKKGNYFLGLLPPEPLATEALRIKEYFRDKYSSKASLNSPPHVTVHMPFEWREDRKDKLVWSLAGFAKEEKRFPVKLNGFGCFAPRVIFISVQPSPDLTAFQGRLSFMCRQEHHLFHPDHADHPFHPHLTVALRDLRKPRFRVAWEEFKNKSFTGEFNAVSLTLLKHDGRRWNRDAEFPFSNG